MLVLLANRSDKEMKSVLRIRFAGVVDDEVNKECYDELYGKIKPLNNRIARLLTAAFEEKRDVGYGRMGPDEIP